MTEKPHDGANATKWCKDCQAQRPLTAFGKNRSTHDGLTHYCREHHRRRSNQSNKVSRANRRQLILESATPKTVASGPAAGVGLTAPTPAVASPPTPPRDPMRRPFLNQTYPVVASDNPLCSNVPLDALPLGVHDVLGELI